MRLPRNPTARLLAVADIIEEHPDHHDQDSFVYDDDGVFGNHPDELAGQGPDVLNKCGTTLCVAGWGIALTPPSQASHSTDWDIAGASALGIESDLASQLFYMDGDAPTMARVLRTIAKIPTGKRTYEAACDAGAFEHISDDAFDGI